VGARLVYATATLCPSALRDADPAYNAALHQGVVFEPRYKSFGRTYKHIQQDDAGAGDAASDPLKMEDQS
jgi:hypothetical protein